MSNAAPKIGPGRRKVRLNLYFTPKCHEQLQELADRMNQSKSAVVGSAIAHLHANEPLVKKRKKKDGDDHTDV